MQSKLIVIHDNSHFSKVRIAHLGFDDTCLDQVMFDQNDVTEFMKGIEHKEEE